MYKSDIFYRSEMIKCYQKTCGRNSKSTKNKKYVRNYARCTTLKLVPAIFIKFLFFHQIIALQKLWKMLFISSKKLFSFSRYSIFVFPASTQFLPVTHWLRGWFKINRKVYGVSICLNENVITHVVWYLEKEKRYDIETLSFDRVLCKEHFHGKIMQKLCTKSQSKIFLNFGK